MNAVLLVGAMLSLVGLGLGWWAGVSRGWHSRLARALIAIGLIPWLADVVWLQSVLGRPVGNATVPAVSVVAEAWPSLASVLVLAGVVFLRPLRLRWLLPSIPLVAAVVEVERTRPMLAQLADHPALAESMPIARLVSITAFAVALGLGFVLATRDVTRASTAQARHEIAATP